jgi:hypothetical protein
MTESSTYSPVLSCLGVDAQETKVANNIRTSKKGITTVLFFIAGTPPCNEFGWKTVAYETFSLKVSQPSAQFSGSAHHLLPRRLTFNREGPDRYGHLRP